MRVVATKALGRFGQDARSALPAISAALNDPEPGVRKFATNALQQIARELDTN
jgi:hypothetical protein